MLAYIPYMDPMGWEWECQWKSECLKMLLNKGAGDCEPALICFIFVIQYLCQQIVGQSLR